MNLRPIDNSDWDADGIKDLLVATMFGRLDLYPGQSRAEGVGVGSPTPLTVNNLQLYVGSYPTGFYYDMDGDGLRDLLLGTALGELWITRGSQSKKLEVR